MDSVSDLGATAPLRYTLTPRLSTDGRVSITLRLYRGNVIAHTGPVAVVERKQAAEVMLKCHQHLGSRGINGTPEWMGKRSVGDDRRDGGGEPEKRLAPKRVGGSRPR